MGPLLDEDGSDSTDRGQTGLDFLVGMSVFLLAVGFVFLFLPTMFDPFVGSGTSNALVADRSAAQLAEETFVDPTHPNVLDDAKVEAFFDGCNASVLESTLGTGFANVNVTLERGGTVELSCGPGQPDDASVTVSRRILADQAGDRYTLFVRAW